MFGVTHWFTQAFVGLWPLVWHFGIGGVIVIGCLAGYFFMPVGVATLFPNIKKSLLGVAFGFMVALVSYSIGVVNEHDRMEKINLAQVNAALDWGEKARDDALKSVAAGPKHRWLRHDRIDRIDPLDRAKR